MIPTPAYAAAAAKAALAPFSIDRREPGPHEVLIDIAYCGVCHSDIHQARYEWGDAVGAIFPMVPGHEIVGTVTRVGGSVTKWKVGDVRRRRLLRGLVSRVRTLPRRRGAVLPRRHVSHLQRLRA